MKLKVDSWYMWLYRATFQKHPSYFSKNGCTIFWGFVLIALFFPIIWFGYVAALLFERKEPDDFPVVWTGIIQTIGSFLLGILFSHKGELYHFWWYLAGFGIEILVTVGIIGVGILINFLGEKHDALRWKGKSKGPKEPRKYLFIEIFKGFKERYCPRITWIYKD